MTAAQSTANVSAPPSIQRLDHWTLVSSDVDRTRTFYTDALGATVPNRPTGPASVILAGTVIDFFPAGEDRAPSPGSWGQHHAYIINLADYDGWVQHLARSGVAYERTTHGFRRMSIYVNDPDGYHIELTVAFENEVVGRREIEKRGLLAEPL